MPFTRSFGRRSRAARLLALAFVLLVVAPPPSAGAAPALAGVPVRYDPALNTIFVGQNYADPALAGYPSAPNAPKTPISIPQVAAALNNPALLQDQGGGAWLLKANLTVLQDARLEATSPAIAWLRLDSTPGHGAGYTQLVADGGHLLVQGVKVTSWQTISSTVDLNYADGRSYMVALDGGRMDLIGSEVAFLGYGDGQPSGVSWRQRGTESRPETGSTGSALDSNIHDNYFGLYAYEAYGVAIKNNQVHNNLFYGVDPHTGSRKFEVAFNQVFANGKHGIIFSRDCVENSIHDNAVHDNAQHGIMLDRGSDNNTIANNLIYGNQDGIAIFQSSNNAIRNNTARDNNVGVRVNATYDATDIFDGISTGNVLQGNTIQNSAQYGVYLYERADRNTLDGNSITGSGGAGVNVKTGGNKILRNEIRGNGTGIAITGGPLSPFPPGGPAPVPALEQPGVDNVIAGNTIADNDTIGVQLKTAANTVVGSDTPGAKPANGNTIQTNGSYGVTMNNTTTDTLVSGNTIAANGGDGVLVKDSASVRNRISRNSITANGGLGIKIGPGASGSVAAPTITSPPNAATVAGKAPANATIEVYRDPNGQGRTFVGQTTASAAGDWSLVLPAGDNPQLGLLTAVAILANGNTSAFGGNTLGGARASYQIGQGRNGELTVFVSGPSARVTLPEIRQALQVISPTANLLEDQGNGVWQANASLFFSRGVTLTLEAPAVTWLKLRSQASPIQPAAAGADPGAYDYDSFVSLRTYNGAIRIDGVKLSSWDPARNDYDRDLSNGRAYVLAKYDARMDIANANLSYLGFADGGSYGVAWRDINDPLAPDALLTRVTGSVTGSQFSYNYYGVYTFQAQNMLFRANTFHHNVGYGFDPHDFSHHFTVEDNEAYANGNHGFIISRGCNNFVFRRNRSHDNRYTIGIDRRFAHGFMIDPGAPDSLYGQAPSHDNLYENNRAWGNDGYGLRIVGSNDNTARGNAFTNNLQGVTIEQGSAGNVIDGNTIAGSALYGVYLYGGADGNTITGNTIARSGRHGIYVKTGGNTIARNTVSDNGSFDAGAGIATYQDSAAAAVADLILPGTQTSMAAVDPDLLNSTSLTSAVAGNVIVGNTLIHNLTHGIELKSATGTRVEGNTARNNAGNGFYLASGAHDNTLKGNVAEANSGYGIRANGGDVARNSWTENSVFGNGAGGIANTGAANGAIGPPQLTVAGQTVSGTAVPGATVEIFSDGGKQGRFFEGRAVAGSNGAFSFTAAQPWRAPNVNATATDTRGNSSGFTYNLGQFVVFSWLAIPLIRR